MSNTPDPVDDTLTNFFHEVQLNRIRYESGGEDKYIEIKDRAKAQLDAHYAKLYQNKIAEAQLIKPGEIIPYTTIKGKDYIELEWLTNRLQQGDKHV